MRIKVILERYTGILMHSGTYPAYHVTFLFTTKGGRQSSDSMDAWIATGPWRIPLAFHVYSCADTAFILKKRRLFR